MKGIADTGFIIAFLNPDDLYHRWAVDVAPQFSEPLITAEAVLAEAAYYLRKTDVVLELVDRGLLRPAFNILEHLARVLDLAQRYADRQPDLADLCVVRLSEMFPKHVVVTVDSDFRVYRRNRRDIIPVLMPPKQ